MHRSGRGSGVWRRSTTAATCRWWRTAASSASSRPTICCSASCPALDAQVAGAGGPDREETALQAEGHAQNELPLSREVQAARTRSLAEIADALDARGVPTSRGGSWAPTTAKRILD